jgi:hypothetical protein
LHAKDRHLNAHLAPGFSEGVQRVAGGSGIGKRTRGVPMLHDLEIRFRVMDMFPGYQQVLSLPTPPIELFAKPADAIECRGLRTTPWPISCGSTPIASSDSPQRCR